MAVAAACPLCGPSYSHTEIACGPDFEYRTTGTQEFRLVRCDRCGIVLLDPRPADEEIAGLYPPDYEPYRFDQLPPLVKMGRDWVQRGKVEVVSRSAPKGGIVVDVGCGGGALLRLIHERTQNFQLVGWDYPGPHLERLATEGITVIAAPIEPQHTPQEVDLFVLNQVIEHCPYPDRVLTMLTRALRPGGRIIVETPDTTGLDAIWFSKRYWGGYHIPRHLVLFNQRNLSELIERSGLRIVETAHLASPAFWVQSLHHLASDSRFPRLAWFCTLRNLPLVLLFSIFDTACSLLTATSNQRVVAEKPS
jgi:SAM-dependent methyltransferase